MIKKTVRFVALTGILCAVWNLAGAQDGSWYVAGGVGASFANDTDIKQAGVTITSEFDTGVFAYQVKAGIGHAFTDALDGTLGYRFLGTADADFVDASGAAFSTDGLQTHVIEMGVRYRF